MSRPDVRSSIDLGTNTCLLLIADWPKGASEPRSVIGDYATVVRLGQGVDRNRRLDPEAMERTLRCLRDYSLKVRAAGADPSETVALATSQARDSSNGPEFFDRIQRETGFCFRIISGEQEADRTFIGALLPGMDPARSAVIDIGGGSTEITALERHGRSLDIGSVRFTERFLRSDPVTDEEFWAAQEAIDEEVSTLRSWRESLAPEAKLVAVAGTATTLAAWHLELAHFDAARIDQVVLSRGDVHRMVEELKWRTIGERCKLGIERGRADVLLAGALILWRALELLNFAEVRISTRGLRYGALKIGS